MNPNIGNKDWALISSVEAHNSLFPERKIDVDTCQSKRGRVMKEFCKDLQAIIGTEQDGVIGVDDIKALSKYGDIQIEQPYPFLKVIRWAMWCKGYSGGDINNDKYGDKKFLSGLHRLQEDSGTEKSDILNRFHIKAIFSMDAYVLVPGTKGDSQIREMQQRMNKYTINYCGISPCDGLPQNKLIKQIVWYMQIVANDPSDLDGEFGSKTIHNFNKNLYNDIKYNLNRSKNEEFLRILQCLLRMNGYKAEITGKFDYNVPKESEPTLKQIRRFKTLMNLDDPLNDSAENFERRNSITNELICALLRSCGLRSRPAIACDTSVIMTQEYCNELIEGGYKIIGRYISGFVGKGRNKALSLDEIQLIRKNGIELFLIFQEGGASINYFKNTQGEMDGNKINQAMKKLQIPMGNVVFVAVDCDMYEDDFREYVIPYFRGINNVVRDYRVGVYSSRLGCKILKEKNLATGFFVSGSSYNFAGNSGVSIPPYWHFEQYCTDIKVKKLDIDKVAVSLNYKDCIVSFNQKESNDYTDIIMKKLKQIQREINERYQHDELINMASALTGNPLVLGGAISGNVIKELAWFFNQVTHKGPWDLKVDSSWEKTIGSDKMPRFSFAGSNEYFFFHGQYITREELGNITYGYLGSAMLIPDFILYIGGGIAAHGDNLAEMLMHALTHLNEYKPPYYGDSPEDHHFVEFGINLYKSLN